MQEGPEELPRDLLEDELKGGMLNRRVVAGLVDRLCDPIALRSGLGVLADIARFDDLRGVARSGGRNRQIVRILEVVLQPDDRFRRNRGVRGRARH